MDEVAVDNLFWFKINRVHYTTGHAILSRVKYSAKSYSRKVFFEIYCVAKTRVKHLAQVVGVCLFVRRLWRVSVLRLFPCPRMDALQSW